MKINVTPYNPQWVLTFNKIQTELFQILQKINSEIEHIGSTSIPGLAAKPIIDVMVGVQSTYNFNQVVEAMLNNTKYVYYKAFNKDAPDRRLFVRLKNEIALDNLPAVFRTYEEIPHDKINPLRIAHIHVWVYGTSEWRRHIAFREYLRNHEEVKMKYGVLKLDLSQKSWKHGMEYNEAKNDFIQFHEKKALDWFKENKSVE